MNSWALKFVCVLTVIAASVTTIRAEGTDSDSTIRTGPHGFPDDTITHASCHMSVFFPGTSCADAKAQAQHLIETNVDTGTEFRGEMSIYDQGSDWIWSMRVTYDKKYIDDQLFEFGEESDSVETLRVQKRKDGETSISSSPSSCLVTMRSRSQSLSVLDYGVNYCSMWNVVSRIEGFDSPDTDPPVVSKCNKRNIPADPVTICARY